MFGHLFRAFPFLLHDMCSLEDLCCHAQSGGAATDVTTHSWAGHDAGGCVVTFSGLLNTEQDSIAIRTDMSSSIQISGGQGCDRSALQPCDENLDKTASSSIMMASLAKPCRDIDFIAPLPNSSLGLKSTRTAFLLQYWNNPSISSTSLSVNSTGRDVKPVFANWMSRALTGLGARRIADLTNELFSVMIGIDSSKDTAGSAAAAARLRYTRCSSLCSTLHLHASRRAGSAPWDAWWHIATLCDALHVGHASQWKLLHVEKDICVHDPFRKNPHSLRTTSSSCNVRPAVRPRPGRPTGTVSRSLAR